MMFSLRKNLILIIYIFYVFFAYSLSPKTPFEDAKTRVSLILGSRAYSKLNHALKNENIVPLEKIKEMFGGRKQEEGFKIIKPEYCNLGNIQSVIDLSISKGGTVLMWSDNTSLDSDKHAHYFQLSTHIKGLKNRYREDFEKLLGLLNISFERDISGSFYYFENSGELRKLEKFHKALEPFISEIISPEHLDEDQILERVKSLFNELKEHFPGLKNDPFIIWFALSNYLRHRLISSEIPLDYQKPYEYESVEKRNAFESSVYERISFVFKNISKVAMEDKVPSDTPAEWTLYQAPVQRLLEYVSLMSDWLNFNNGDNINYFLSEAFYQNYLLEHYINNVHFRSSKIMEGWKGVAAMDYKRQFNDWQDKFLKAGKMSSKTSRDNVFDDSDRRNDVLKAFDSVSAIEGYLKTLITHIHFTLNQCHQMDISNQRRILSGLRLDMQMLFEGINKAQFFLEKAKKYWVKIKNSYRGMGLEGEKLIRSADEQLSKMETLWDGKMKLRKFLKNLEFMIMTFRTGESQNENHESNFKDFISSSGPSEFYFTRSFAPDRVDYTDEYLPEGSERYNTGITFLEDVLQQKEDPGLYQKEGGNKTYFNFLFQGDQRLFRCFYFWDFKYSKEKENKHIEFLKDLVENDTLNSHFAAIELAYYYLFQVAKIKDTAQEDKQKEFLKLGAAYFLTAFEHIPDVVKMRENFNLEDDTGYIKDFSPEMVSPEMQEVNRLLNFFYILLTDTRGPLKVPNTIIHKNGDLPSYHSEQAILQVLMKAEAEKGEGADWNLVIMMQKYLLSIGLKPYKKDLDNNLGELIKHGIPDAVLEKLLVSLFYDYHRFSLVYADYIINAFKGKPELEKKYSKSYALSEKFFSEKKYSAITLSCYLAQYYLVENRHIDSAPLLIEIAGRMPEGYESDFDYNKMLDALGSDGDGEAIKPLITFFQELDAIEKYLRGKVVKLSKITINEKLKETTVQSYLEILDEIWKDVSDNESYLEADSKVKDRIDEITKALNRDKFSRKVAFYYMAKKFGEIEFNFRRTKKDPDNIEFSDFIESRYLTLKFIIDSMNVLKDDVLKSQTTAERATSLKALEESFFNLNEILKFTRSLKDISEAYSNKKYFKASILLPELKEKFDIKEFSLTPSSSAPKSKKNKKGKKKKLKNKPNSQLNMPRVFNHFPAGFNNEVMIFLQMVQKQVTKLDKEDFFHKEKIQKIARHAFLSYVAEDNFPGFDDLKRNISDVEDLMSARPYLFEVNPFDPNDETDLYEYYETIKIEEGSDLLLKELNDYQFRVSLKKQEISDLFSELKKIKTRDLKKIAEVFSKLDELKKIDKKSFNETVEEIGGELRQIYSKLEPAITMRLAKSYDYVNNHINHEVLAPDEHTKINMINFVSTEFLKWFHSEKIYPKVVSTKTLKTIERLEYLSHRALVVHDLKINRLSLSAQNMAEEIRREETQTAFRREIKDYKQNGIFGNCKEFNKEIGMSENGTVFHLSIDSMPGFMDKDTRPQKKYEKAKWLFKNGARVIFFDIKDGEEIKHPLKKVGDEPVAVFEIINVVQSSQNDSGAIYLTLSNPEDFPVGTTLPDILKYHIPKPKSGHKSYFFTKDSFDTRDRFLFFDRLLSNLLENADKKFNFDGGVEMFELSREFANSTLLNAALGLYGSHMKHEIEKVNNAVINNDISLGDKISEEKNQIFRKMIEYEDSSNPLHQIDWVNAPGGTGKTHFAKYLIHYLIKKIKGMIFVCTPTHRAVDKVTMDIVFKDKDDDKDLSKHAVRVANPEVKEKIHPLIRKEVWLKREEKLLELIKNKLGIIFSTSTGFNGDPVVRDLRRKETVNKGKDPLLGEYLIYDEAGNDSYENFLYFLSKQGKENSKVLVLGDVLQLGPFGMSDEGKDEILKRMKPFKMVKNFEGVNLTETLFSNFYLDSLRTSPLQRFHGSFGFKRHFLTENRRSGKAIVELLNRTGYSKYAREMVSVTSSNVPETEQVKFINAPSPGRNELRRNKDGKLQYGEHLNFKEIEKILIQMGKDFIEYPDLSGSDVAFISPYKAQNKLFRLSVQAFAIFSQLKEIEKSPLEEIESTGNEITGYLKDLNELILIYGGKSNVLIPEKFFNKHNYTIFDLKDLRYHLKINMPWFIPRIGGALTLKRISNIDAVDLNDLNSDEADEAENSSDMDIVTIHKKQGGQSRAVYFSAVRRNRDGRVGFMEEKNGPRMLHVAFGRAKDFLRVAADFDTWQKAGRRPPDERNKEDKYRIPSRKESSDIMTEGFKVAREINRRRFNNSLKPDGSSKLPKKAA